MPRKPFKITTSRITSCLFWPCITAIFFILIIIYRNQAHHSYKLFELGVMLISLSYFIIPPIVLLVNHYRHSKEIILEIIDKTVTIISKEGSKSFGFTEINKIIEYHTYKRTPMGVPEFWQIETSNNTYYISSLIISKSDFDRFFWNKIEEKIVLWPNMNQKVIVENISERTSE